MIEPQKAVQDFLFHCQYEKNLAEKTLTAYASDLDQFQLFLKEEAFSGTVGDIDKNRLRSYLKRLSERAKPKTVKRKFATLKVFFSFLELEDHIVVSPFRKMRVKIVLENRLPVVMTLPEVRRLFRYLYQRREQALHTSTQRLLYRDIAVFEMLFATGMRVAELVGLNLRDVDLESGTVRIFGKGRRERIVPICNEKVKSALHQYLAFAAAKRQSDRFFLGRSGVGITEQTVRIMVDKHTRQAGLDKKITPHTFRHTLATLLLENGVDIRNIQKILGHSNITTTELYVKVNQEAQRVLMERHHPRELF